MVRSTSQSIKDFLLVLEILLFFGFEWFSVVRIIFFSYCNSFFSRKVAIMGSVKTINNRTVSCFVALLVRVGRT